MARFNANRVSYRTQDRLLGVFCGILCKLRTPIAVENFLKDILNRQERMMVVRRFLIAERLLEGKTYDDIRAEYGVGSTTIARVARWLHFGRGGYKTAVSAKKKSQSIHSHTS